MANVVQVANLAGAASVSDGAYVEGSLLFVTSIRRYFALNKTATDPLKTGVILATLSGTGRWRYVDQDPTDFLTQAAWFVDPAAGNDENSGKTSGAPVKTFAEIVRRWGTNSPTLAQATTITFLSDQPDDTDPVILSPRLLDPGFLCLKGSLVQVAWGASTLGTVTAATATVPLKMDLGATASAAVGFMVDNTTHASRCWVDSSVTTVATVTNPMAKQTAPSASALMPTTGQAVAGQASADAFTIQRPTKVYLTQLTPIVSAGPSSYAGPQATIHQIWCPDTAGAGASQSLLNDNVWCQECRFDTWVTYETVGVNNGNKFGFFNCWLSGGGLFVGCNLYAGAVGTVSAFLQYFSSSTVDGGLLTTGGNTFQQVGGIGPSGIGLAYFLGGSTHTFYGITVLLNSGYGLGLKGVYTLSVGQNSCLAYKTSAALSFLGTSTLKINGLTTAWSVTAAQPSVWNNAITINVANLDAAAGAAGFGGVAIDLFSGGSIAKAA